LERKRIAVLTFLFEIILLELMCVFSTIPIFLIQKLVRLLQSHCSRIALSFLMSVITLIMHVLKVLRWI